MSKGAFESIVLSGGGIRGYYLLGALEYYYRENTPDDGKINYFNYETVKEYRGTSVGSVICTLLGVGYTPMEIFEKILEDDVLKPTSTHHIFQIMQKKSLMSIEKLINYVGEMLEEKGFYSQVTFEEFYNHTNKNLFITGTNFSRKNNKAVIFCKDSFSGMPILKAVEISCSVFPIFPLVTFQGEIYGDGGFTDNFPLDNSSKLKTLGVYLYSEFELKADSGIMDLMIQAVMTPIVELTTRNIQQRNENTTVVGVCTGDISFFTLVVSKEDKIDMFKKGNIAAQEEDKSQEFHIDIFVEKEKQN